MGEAQEWLFEPEFNRAIKVQGTDERLTSDAGFLLLREVDHRLGLVESLVEGMTDARDPDNIRYTFCELLRQRIYALAQGYRDQDDQDRLAHDPAMKMAVWDRPGQQVIEERLASQPTHSRLLCELSHLGSNRQCLRNGLGEWVGRHLRASGQGRRARRGTLDLDSFPIEVHGKQVGGAYNGYYRTTVYHPLLASFSVDGDYDSPRLGCGFVHAILRKGNVHTAEGVLRFLQQALPKAEALGYVLTVRIDAGFTHRSVLDWLTNRGTRFIGRLADNPVLDRLAAPYLKRPAGRPPREGYEFTVELGMHQAESWQHAQRLILVVVDRPDPRTGQLNLQPDYFFLVTNCDPEELPADAVLEAYRKRGTFEDRFGEFNECIDPRLSSPDFQENETTLLLALLAFNLASMLRGELEQASGNGWDLGRVQQTVLKAGGRVAKHSRRLLVSVARSVMPLWQWLFNAIRHWHRGTPARRPRGPQRREWVPPPPHAHLREVLRC